MTSREVESTSTPIWLPVQTYSWSKQQAPLLLNWIPMVFGNMPTDGGQSDSRRMTKRRCSIKRYAAPQTLLRQIFGSQELSLTELSDIASGLKTSRSTSMR